MGHEKLDTTYNSYGILDANAQRRAMLKIGKAPKPETDMRQIIREEIAALEKDKKGHS